jgi:hypothetical protein
MKKINYKKETENGEQGNLVRGTENKGTRKREHENEGENGKGTAVQPGEQTREQRKREGEKRSPLLLVAYLRLVPFLLSCSFRALWILLLLVLSLLASCSTLCLAWVLLQLLNLRFTLLQTLVCGSCTLGGVFCSFLFPPTPVPPSLRTLGAWSPHFQLLGFLVSAVPPASVTAVAVCQLGDPFLHCEEEREEASSFLFFFLLVGMYVVLGFSSPFSSTLFLFSFLSLFLWSMVCCYSFRYVRGFCICKGGCVLRGFFLFYFFALFTMATTTDDSRAVSISS